MTWTLSDGDWCHEIPAKDLGRSQKFYEEVFGWQFMDIPGLSTKGDGMHTCCVTLDLEV